MRPIIGGIVKGQWAGGYGKAPEICQRPGIYVTAAGSNSAWTGFADLAEAQAFVEAGVPGDLSLRIVDLRPLEKRYPLGQSISITYENGNRLTASVVDVVDDLTLHVLVDAGYVATLRRDPGGLVLAAGTSEYCHAVMVEMAEPEEEPAPSM